MEQKLVTLGERRVRVNFNPSESDYVNDIKTVREEITRILYQNSSDDSECMRIKFENIQKVIDELNQLLTFKN
jgi:hypothetical protein